MGTPRNLIQEIAFTAQFVPATRSPVFDFGGYSNPAPSLRRVRYLPRSPYAMSGTDRAYAATQLGDKSLLSSLTESNNVLELPDSEDEEGHDFPAHALAPSSTPGPGLSDNRQLETPNSGIRQLGNPTAGPGLGLSSSAQSSPFQGPRSLSAGHDSASGPVDSLALGPGGQARGSFQVEAGTP